MFFISKICFSFVVNPHIMKNYFDILKISYQADAQQIRHAYRQMSMRYHPDRHGGRKDYEEKFKEINEAYQVLKDPIRRWQYRRDMQPRSGASRFSKKWETPDFAAPSRPAGRARRPQRRRPGPPGDEQGMDFPGIFWSCVLLLVFLFPFSMVEQAPAQSADQSFVSYQMEGAGFYDDAGYNVKERIDRRYKQDFQHLQEIQRIDPGLRGLNIETGYYELHGKTIKLSWEILKLIREKQWKRR
jgi:hypothetical protein